MKLGRWNVCCNGTEAATQKIVIWGDFDLGQVFAALPV
jgi:hypothetical protein